MSGETVIRVSSVSKKFCRSLKHTMMYGVADLSRNFMGLAPSSDRLRSGEFWAVDDISFELKRGECIGLIGPNGSGKSTLLKMLNGIFMPDCGEIRVNGKVGALIEVGAGFHPMLTGRENVYVGGAILGMGKKEVDDKFDEILEFADIGDFIDSPVKHYSSGMFVRLGFAVAAHLKPEVLLIDEILAVGDIQFQIKCLNYIRSLIDGGTTVIFVSHNLYQVQRVCNRALIVQKGKNCSIGDTDTITSKYEKMFAKDGLGESQPINTNDFQFTSFSIESSPGAEEKSNHVITHQPMRIVISYCVQNIIENNIQIGLLLKTFDGQRVFGYTTRHSNVILPGDIGKYRICFDFPDNLLLQGNYYFSVSAFDAQYENQLASWDMCATLRVETPGYNGLFAVGAVDMCHRVYLM